MERAADLIHKVYHEAKWDRARSRRWRNTCRRRARKGTWWPPLILNQAADELITAATAVMARLNLQDEPFSFVLAGGMFHAVPWLCDQLQLLLPSLAPQSSTMRLEAEPAMGAVQLALAELHGGARVPATARTSREAEHLPHRGRRRGGGRRHRGRTAGRRNRSRCLGCRPAARRSGSTKNSSGCTHAGRADFSRAHTFNLDEFIGLTSKDRRSYCAFMENICFGA